MTKALISDPPAAYGDLVNFRITLTNTGGTAIIELPLTDIYPVEFLRFIAAAPPPADANDDGEMTWSDLTDEFGQLLPGNSVEVIAQFTLKAFPPENDPIVNVASVEAGYDEYGNLVSAAAEARVIPAADCTDLYVNNSEITLALKDDAPAGRNVLLVSAVVRNRGPFAVQNAHVYFAFELTPADPADDPNPGVIGVAETGPISISGAQTVMVEWDVTAMDQSIRPIYVVPLADDYAECAVDYAQTDVTVPVKLAGFSATPVDGAVELAWTTETEIANLGFRLYRSEDPFAAFIQIGPRLIPGAMTSFDRHCYEYVDRSLTNGRVYFYRLAMIDAHGRIDFSSIVCAAPRRVPVDIHLRVAADGFAQRTETSVVPWIWLENNGPDHAYSFCLALLREHGEPDIIVAETEVAIPAGFSGRGQLENWPVPPAAGTGRRALFAFLRDGSTGALTAVSYCELQ